MLRLKTALVIGALTTPSAAMAQDVPLDTDAEVAACAVIEEVARTLQAQVAAEDVWLNENRPSQGEPRSAYDAFNVRAAARNAIDAVAGRFIDDYNTQCTGEVLYDALQSVCAMRSDQMTAYLYDGTGCTRHRQNDSK